MSAKNKELSPQCLRWMCDPSVFSFKTTEEIPPLQGIVEQERDALLSSLSKIPIKQGIAVTGSVNQSGQVQPIGGVNQKIEGFFDVCKTQGLTGTQGVMIPGQNVKNLMLRHDVVDAVAAGTFHIYAAGTIDEGIEILTGIPAGEKTDQNTFPEGTVNYRVERRLKEFAEALRTFGLDADTRSKGLKD